MGIIKNAKELGKKVQGQVFERAGYVPQAQYERLQEDFEAQRAEVERQGQFATDLSKRNSGLQKEVLELRKIVTEIPTDDGIYKLLGRIHEQKTLDSLPKVKKQINLMAEKRRVTGEDVAEYLKKCEVLLELPSEVGAGIVNLVAARPKDFADPLKNAGFTRTDSGETLKPRDFSELFYESRNKGPFKFDDPDIDLDDEDFELEEPPSVTEEEEYRFPKGLAVGLMIILAVVILTGFVLVQSTIVGSTESKMEMSPTVPVEAFPSTLVPTIHASVTPLPSTPRPGPTMTSTTTLTHSVCDLFPAAEGCK